MKELISASLISLLTAVCLFERPFDQIEKQKPAASPPVARDAARDAFPAASPSNLSSSPPIELSSTPAQISIALTGGGQEKRNVLLTSNGTSKELKLITLDLSRNDHRAVIDAQRISVQDPPLKIANDLLKNNWALVPFTFNLSGLPSGEYSGEIRAQVAGGKLNIPINIKIKDHWLPPLGVLLLGIVTGLIVTQYRERGKPRDETVVRGEELRSLMQSEPSLDEHFKSRIESLLVDVDALLKAGKWEDATTTIVQAEAVIDRWRKGRDDWRAQLAYRKVLMEKIKEFGDSASLPTYLLNVLRAVEDAGRVAPDLDGPDKLRDRLDLLGLQLNSYLQLDNRLKRLNLLIDDLEVNRNDWIARAQKLRRSIDALSPEDTAGAERLREEIEAAIVQIETLSAKQPHAKARAEGAISFGDDLTLLNLVSPAPTARALEMIAADEAGRRLKWFKRATYILAVLLLASAGFSELYINNPLFGANLWGDYFSLLAWGFGAEATRAAVTGLMKNWGM